MSPVFRAGPDVAVTPSVDGATVYAARLPAGPIIVLVGAGSIIWQEATSGGSAGWVERVADTFQVLTADIVDDVLAFVEDLSAQGLLARDVPDLSGPD